MRLYNFYSYIVVLLILTIQYSIPGFLLELTSKPVNNLGITFDRCIEFNAHNLDNISVKP